MTKKDYRLILTNLMYVQDIIALVTGNDAGDYHSMLEEGNELLKDMYFKINTMCISILDILEEKDDK